MNNRSDNNYKNALNIFKKDGWIILNTNYKKYESLKKIFFNKLKTKFPKLKKKSTDDIRAILNNFNEEINYIRNLYIPELSQIVYEAVLNDINNIFGKKSYLLQRNVHIDVNKSKDIFTKTVTHSEIMAGHSPFTYTIWLPFHSIIDNSGLYLLNLKDSLSIIDNFDVNDKKTKKFIKDKYFFPKLNEGEAILFSSFNLHGSEIHNNPFSRVSINLRIQSSSEKFFQKDSLYFKKI